MNKMSEWAFGAFKRMPTYIISMFRIYYATQSIRITSTHNMYMRDSKYSLKILRKGMVNMSTYSTSSLYIFKWIWIGNGFTHKFVTSEYTNHITKLPQSYIPRITYQKIDIHRDIYRERESGRERECLGNAI